MTNVSEQDRRSDRAGQDAIKHLSQPVKGRIVVAQACTVLSALLSFVPYLALVQLGDLFLGAQAAGQPVDAARAHEVVSVLVMAFPLAVVLPRSGAHHHPFRRHEAALRHPPADRRALGPRAARLVRRDGLPAPCATPCRMTRRRFTR